MRKIIQNQMRGQASIRITCIQQIMKKNKNKENPWVTMINRNLFKLLWTSLIKVKMSSLSLQKCLRICTPNRVERNLWLRISMMGKKKNKRIYKSLTKSFPSVIFLRILPSSNTYSKSWQIKKTKMSGRIAKKRIS